MKSDYPLFPELSEQGKEEAQKLINKFKIKIKEAADEVIGDLYCDIVCHIESDSWTNFRNDLLAGFKDYNNRKIQANYDFKEIRQAILKLHREDIIKDLNQDMLDKIDELKESIKFLQEIKNSY